MMLAIDRMLADIVKRVVHPTHVPFVAKTEAAPVDRAGNHRPCGRLLSRGGRVRKSGKYLDIATAQKSDRLKILPPAMLVRNPAALGTAVIEIEHRGDRIDAQAIGPVTIKPEEPVHKQEIRDLGATEIVDQGVPVEMAALHRMGVLIYGGAIKLRESMRVIGKMARHPVE
jgi:hypothetical protein